MIHGLDGQRFVDKSRTTAAASARLESASSVYRAWRKLTLDKRLAAVERRLSAINLSDGYPLTL